MRTQFISLALAIVLMCPFGSAQWVQTNGLNDMEVLHHPLMDTNVSQESRRELLGLPSQHRVRADFINRPNSLPASGTQLPLPYGGFIPNGNHRSPSFQKKMLSPQSQIYLIDTVIVRSTVDTTRHLYSFNGKGRRTTDLTQKLRAALWVDTLRHTYTYDANNNILSDVSEQCLNGQWVGFTGSRNTSTYDANGHMLTSLYEYWLNTQWVNGSRATYTYDANGNMLSGLVELWLSGQWVNSRRNTRTYDANGHMLTSLNEYCQNGQWRNESRATYTYDANGNILTEMLECLYYSQRLYNSHRYTYKYDANGNKLIVLLEYWDSDKGWEIVLLEKYTYDADGNLSSNLHEEFRDCNLVFCRRTTYTFDANGKKLTELAEISSNGPWENVLRYTYAYDALGNLLTWLWEGWLGGQWANLQRNTYAYFANGSKLTELREEWLNGEWVLRSTYTYDAKGNMLTSLVVDYSFDTYAYDGQGNLTSYWHYSWLNSSWTPTDLVGRSTFGISDSAGNGYYYSGYNFTFTHKLLVTGVASHSGNVPAVYSLSQNYPNPFNPTTKIQFTIVNRQLTILKVYDVLGRDVATLVNEVKEPGTYIVQFDGSSLASGVYFYQLKAGTFVETKKLLLLR